MLPAIGLAILSHTLSEEARSVGAEKTYLVTPPLVL